MWAESSSDTQRAVSVGVNLGAQTEEHAEHNHERDSTSHDGEVCLDLLVWVHVEPWDIRGGCCGHDLSLTSAPAGLQAVSLDYSPPRIVGCRHRQGDLMRPSSRGHGGAPRGAPRR